MDWMHTSGRLIKGLGLGLLLFLLLEFSYRYYLFGLTGLNPASLINYTNLLRSGLVQPSENIEIWYELKPDLDTWFRGARFKTNSHGLADKEYSFNKPPDTFRVAVVGSSWTMGSGLPLEHTFHSVLEDELNNVNQNLRYEFINFGVENYGLGEIIATIRHRIPRYEPDLVIAVMTGFTPRIYWQKHSEPFIPKPDPYAGLHSLVLIQIMDLLGSEQLSETRITANQQRMTVFVAGNSSYMGQIERALKEMEQLGIEKNFDVAAVWLHMGIKQEERVKQFLAAADTHNINALVLDLESFLAKGQDVSDLLINRSEKHPNAATHRKIAARIRESILDNP